MRLKDFSILNPQYNGASFSSDVSFVPMESLRNGHLDLKEIPFLEGKGKYTYFANGDLLIAKVTPCFENGNIAIAEELKNGIGFGSSEIFVLRMKNNVLNKYLFYFVQNTIFQDAACATMCGVGGLKRISPLIMRTFELVIPPLPKQIQIVNYLDKKIAEIDTQISLLLKKRDAYMRLKKSIIHCAVTHGLNPDVEMKDSGVDWIGLMPKHWEVKRIKELCPFISRGSTPDYVDEGNYLVMNQAVFSSGSINYEIVRFSSYMKDDSKIEKGDLLIASTGGGILGKLYFFDDEQTFYADAHVTIVRNKKKSFHVKFLYYLLSIEYNMINSCMAKGSTNQTELQRDKLIAFEIAVPPVDEQKRIIEYLDIKCANIEAAIKNIGKQIDALKRLKRALINEVVIGLRAV